MLLLFLIKFWYTFRMTTNLIVQTLFISFIIQIVFFIYAAWFKTDKVTDLSYGLTFVLLAISSLLINKTYLTYQIIVTLMVLIWGVRISTYLFIRILKTKRDKRFDGIRENFWKFAQFWFFQALAVWMISLPGTYLFSLNNILPINFVMGLGIFIWFFGILIETIADIQKFNFKNNKKNDGKWIQSGIWKYSRHPNYFGEMLCWWGIFVFSMPFQSGISWLTVLGPIFISFILLFVSGIPTLEKKYSEIYKNNSEYQDYKKRTSLLVPLPLK